MTRNPDHNTDPFPDRLIARCSREQAEALVRYDHHRVNVDGRHALILTYHWLPLEESPDPLWLRVVFQRVAGHPAAPCDIQPIIDQLDFIPSPKESTQWRIVSSARFWRAESPPA